MYTYGDNIHARSIHQETRAPPAWAPLPCMQCTIEGRVVMYTHGDELNIHARSIHQQTRARPYRAVHDRGACTLHYILGKCRTLWGEPERVHSIHT